MRKIRFEDIINSNIVVNCVTEEQCIAIVDYFRKYHKSSDVRFTEIDAFRFSKYGKNTCLAFNRDEWTFCSTTFYIACHREVISYNDISFTKGLYRGFEVVSNRKTEGEITLPKRGTSQSMAYDFFSPKDFIVAPGEIAKIWTDVKAYMQYGEGLILNVRSSMGGKFMLANTQGWIEPDYYNNENNEGNIGFFLKNISDTTLTISMGDRIGQGMFIPFLVSDNGNPEDEVTRKGGFGSTGK